MLRPVHHLLLLLALLVVISSATLYAQRIGGAAASFLQNPPVARDAGFTGAFSAFTPGASAIFSNSASLPLLTQPVVSVSASPLPLGQSVVVAGFGTRMGEFAGLGIGIVRFGSGNVDQRDGSGRKIGTISNQDLSLAVGGGMAVGPGTIGATLRYLRQDVSERDGGANGYAVDLSGTLSFEQQLFMSVGINNIAGGMHATNESTLRWIIPWDARIGATYILALEDRHQQSRPDPSGIPTQRPVAPRTYILALGEIRTAQNDSGPTLSLALEAVPIAGVDVGFRGGWNSDGDIALGLLIGLPVDFTTNLRLDYALRHEAGFGAITHYVTLTAAL